MLGGFSIGMPMRLWFAGGCKVVERVLLCGWAVLILYAYSILWPTVKGYEWSLWSCASSNNMFRHRVVLEILVPIISYVRSFRFSRHPTSTRRCEYVS